MASGRDTCENCLWLDIRVMHRRMQLWPAGLFVHSWVQDEKQVGSVEISNEPNRVFLSYRCQDLTTQTLTDVHQLIHVAWTSCNFGGYRDWFVCPGSGCGKRVAVLYLGSSGLFACRRCQNLAYATQFERLGRRGVERARRIRMKLGGGANLLDPFPDRPKGMHQRTYARLRDAYRTAATRCGAG
jgi:hypothetical protein